MICRSLIRNFSSKQKGAPKFFKEYVETFNKSGALEMVLPREVKHVDDLRSFGLTVFPHTHFGQKGDDDVSE